MAYCTNCGSQIGNDDIVCRNCGQVLKKPNEHVRDQSFTCNEFGSRPQYGRQTTCNSYQHNQYNRNYVSSNTNQADIFAIVGFALSMIGVIVVSLVLSIMGLKSEKYRGLAIAGVVISSLVVLVIVFCFLIGIGSSIFSYL